MAKSILPVALILGVRSLFFTSLLILFADNSLHADDAAESRKRAEKLYAESLELRKNWKSVEDFRKGMELALEARYADSTYEPAVLDYWQRLTSNQRTSIEGVSAGIKELEELLKFNPKSLKTRFALAWMMVELEVETSDTVKYGTRIQELAKEMSKLDPKNGSGLLIVAWHSMSCGEVDSAIESVNSALVLSSLRQELAYSLRGQIYQRIGLYRSAIGDLSRAYEILDAEVSKMPTEFYSSWGIQLRRRSIMDRAVSFYRLGETEAYDRDVKLAMKLIPESAAISAEDVLEGIKDRCEFADKNSKIRWDRFPGTIGETEFAAGAKK